MVLVGHFHKYNKAMILDIVLKFEMNKSLVESLLREIEAAQFHSLTISPSRLPDWHHHADPNRRMA